MSGLPTGRDRRLPAGAHRVVGPSTLADVLDRVLDKGLVVAGDIRINISDVELLTIKLRLLVASVDTARDMGISWWDDDPFISGSARRLERENAELRERLQLLEGRLRALGAGVAATGEDPGEPGTEAARADDGGADDGGADDGGADDGGASEDG